LHRILLIPFCQICQKVALSPSISGANSVTLNRRKNNKNRYKRITSYMPDKVYKVSRRRVLTDPVFELTRQNNAEFSRVGMANRLLRHALRLALKPVADRYVSGRLTKPMMKVLQSDPVNNRGERRVTMGDLSMLEGFNFNRATSLQQVFQAPYTVHYDQDAAQVDIDMPSLIPHYMLQAPSEAGAFSIHGIAAAVDFEGNPAVCAEPVQTDIYELSSQVAEVVHLSMPVPAGKTHPVVVCMGIQFCASNRGRYSLLDKQYQAMAIVKVFRS
jgi:hypothetical protein